MKRPPFLRDVGLDLLTLGILFVVLLPILWVFLASVRPDSDIASGGWTPQRFTIRHYQEIIAFPGFLVALKNSLIVGITVAASTTTMAVPAAYALSRLSFRGRNSVALVILGTQMLPSVAVLVPLVVIVRQIGLSNTLIALIFTHLSLGMPIAVWMLFRSMAWTATFRCSRCASSTTAASSGTVRFSSAVTLMTSTL